MSNALRLEDPASWLAAYHAHEDRLEREEAAVEQRMQALYAQLLSDPDAIMQALEDHMDEAYWQAARPILYAALTDRMPSTKEQADFGSACEETLRDYLRAQAIKQLDEERRDNDMERAVAAA